MAEHIRARKAALVAKGITGLDIAAATGVSNATVSHVVAGRRLLRADALRVMRYVAQQTGIPASALWPETVADAVTPAA